MDRYTYESIARIDKERRLDRRQRKELTPSYEGQEHSRRGNSTTIARYPIPISNDMIYLNEWSFKLDLQPMYVYHASSSESTNLNIAPHSDHILPGSPHPSGSITHDNNHVLSPNPHSHAISSGIFPVASVPENLRITIDGFDLTPFFWAQFPTQNPQAAGWAFDFYPNDTYQDRFNIYDAAMAYGGAAPDVILKPGLHFFEISVSPTDPNNSGAFEAVLQIYAQYVDAIK